MADVEGGIRQLQTRRDGVFSSESRWRNGMDRGELGANLEYQEFLWYVASPASFREVSFLHSNDFEFLSCREQGFGQFYTIWVTVDTN
jgi:hypothetical protein